MGITTCDKMAQAALGCVGVGVQSSIGYSRHQRNRLGLFQNRSQRRHNDSLRSLGDLEKKKNIERSKSLESSFRLKRRLKNQHSVDVNNTKLNRFMKLKVSDTSCSQLVQQLASD